MDFGELAVVTDYQIKILILAGDGKKYCAWHVMGQLPSVR